MELPDNLLMIKVSKGRGPFMTSLPAQRQPM